MNWELVIIGIGLIATISAFVIGLEIGQTSRTNKSESTDSQANYDISCDNISCSNNYKNVCMHVRPNITADYCYSYEEIKGIRRVL